MELVPQVRRVIGPFAAPKKVYILKYEINVEAKRKVPSSKFCLSDRHKIGYGHIEAWGQSGGEEKRACLRTKHQRFRCKSGQFVCPYV